MELQRKNQPKKSEKSFKRDSDWPRSGKSRRRKKSRPRENEKLKKRKRNEQGSRFFFTFIRPQFEIPYFQARQEQKEREQQEKLAKMEEKRTVTKKGGKSKLQRQRELAEEKAKQAQK